MVRGLRLVGMASRGMDGAMSDRLKEIEERWGYVLNYPDEPAYRTDTERDILSLFARVRELEGELASAWREAAGNAALGHRIADERDALRESVSNLRGFVEMIACVAEVNGKKVASDEVAQMAGKLLAATPRKMMSALVTRKADEEGEDGWWKR